MWFAKFKSQHISVFQDWKHILLLTTDYTGASKKHRMSTVGDISVLRVMKTHVCRECIHPSRWSMACSSFWCNMCCQPPCRLHQDSQIVRGWGKDPSSWWVLSPQLQCHCKGNHAVGSVGNPRLPTPLKKNGGKSSWRTRLEFYVEHIPDGNSQHGQIFAFTRLQQT